MVDPSAFFKVECCGETNARRDSQMLRYASSKGCGLRRSQPSRGSYCGSAMSRLVSDDSPFRSNLSTRCDSHPDIAFSVPVNRDVFGVSPGRYVPIGYGEYVSPTINRYDYRFYTLAGWRVAVPRSIPPGVLSNLLYRIYNYGPQSAGYARIGDTLVPSMLGPGERLALAESVVNSDYVKPLSY